MQKYLLGPLLLAQGKWVRYKTPRLPEPKQNHEGVIGHGVGLKLLLLGDSSAAGVGAETAEQSLLGQLLKNLSPNYQVSYRMLAKTGQTTAGMIKLLKAQSAQQYDVIITALGVNDVTAQVPVQQWVAQQQELISKLKVKFNPQKIIVSGLPPVREFPALPWPLNHYMGHYADQFNQAILDLTAQDEQLSFQSLRDYPVEAQAATDGFHPGPKVYELWAQFLTDNISKLELG